MAKRQVDILLKLKDETKKGSKSAVKNIDDIEKKAEFSGKKAALAIAAIGASAIVAAVGVKKLINEFVAMGDQLDKVSTRLGVAVDKLAAYHFAAKKAGIATTTLNMAWQRMARRISEAAQGMGEAKNALVEMNLNAQELNQLSPDEQFLKIMNALEGAGNQADRLRLAMRMFDSEGVAMIQMLGTMEESLGFFKETAPDMEQIAVASKKWKDATADLSVVMLELKASALVPWIETLTVKMNEWTVAFLNAKKAMEEGPQYDPGTSILDDMFGTPEEVEHLTSNISHLFALMEKDFTPIEIIDIEGIEQALAGFEEIEAAILHVQEMAQLTADKIIENMAAAPVILKDMTAAFSEFDLAIMRAMEGFEEIQAGIDATKESTDDTSDAARRLGSAINSTFSTAVIDIFINKAKSLSDILLSVATSLLRVGIQLGISAILSPAGGAAAGSILNSAPVPGAADFIGPLPLAGASGVMAGQAASYVSPYDLPSSVSSGGSTILMNVGIPESRAGIVRMQDGVAELLDNRSKGII